MLNVVDISSSKMANVCPFSMPIWFDNFSTKNVELLYNVDGIYRWLVMSVYIEIEERSGEEEEEFV